MSTAPVLPVEFGGRVVWTPPEDDQPRFRLGVG